MLTLHPLAPRIAWAAVLCISYFTNVSSSFALLSQKAGCRMLWCSDCVNSGRFVNTNQSFKLQKSALKNVYDDWRSDAVVDTMYLCDENVIECLDEFINSNYGKQMFGCHDVPASVGITGELDFVELHGPEVVLSLKGAFWHRRETVLGRAAMWLNARMPEITDVTVEDMEELQDFEEIIDDWTGEVLFRKDKRSPDFNGDRETMEYQGIDPDVRGPFPPGIQGGGPMINPM